MGIFFAVVRFSISLFWYDSFSIFAGWGRVGKALAPQYLGRARTAFEALWYDEYDSWHTPISGGL
jgi:hypothetical protein